MHALENLDYGFYRSTSDALNDWFGPTAAHLGLGDRGLAFMVAKFALELGLPPRLTECLCGIVRSSLRWSLGLASCRQQLPVDQPALQCSDDPQALLFQHYGSRPYRAKYDRCCGASALWLHQVRLPGSTPIPSHSWKISPPRLTKLKRQPPSSIHSFPILSIMSPLSYQ